jgi:hypothetical protein
MFFGKLKTKNASCPIKAGDGFLRDVASAKAFFAKSVAGCQFGEMDEA